MHNLLILSRDSDLYKQIIENERFNDLSISAPETVEDALQAGDEFDLVFGEPSLIAQVITNLSNIKWVQSSWAGVEPLLMPGLPRNYILTNARNVYGWLMAEYVFGYLLMVERRIISRWQSQRLNKWDESPSGTLKGKIIGLLGVGSIGSHLAKTAKHFGMQVHGYTRRSEVCSEVDRYFHGAELLNFAADLDYIVCSLPGTAETKELLGTEFFSALPRNAWLVNIGRGNLIDEAALVNALCTGAISGAVLDVFSEEPLPENHPLWKAPNTFITSHTAAKNYPPDIAALFIENYKLFVEGKDLLHQVDFDLQY